MRALALSSLVASFLLLLPNSSTAAPALHVSRTTVITGESVTISGTVGGTSTRRVLLQRRGHATWVAITTAATSPQGAFQFRYRPPASTTGITLRVLAPAARSGSRPLPAVVSGTQTVSTVAPVAHIKAPSTAPVARSVPVKGTFSPARPGRATQVQRWDDGSWATIATGTQDRSGGTSFTIGLAEPGTRALRVRTLGTAGAPDTVSATHQITITPATTPARPGPTGVTATASDGQAAVTWDRASAADLKGYRLYSAPSLNGPWSSLTPEPLGPEHEPTFTASGLTNGTTYAFAVTSVTTSGIESSRSLSELVTPLAAPADCGPALKKADGSTWTCTLAEDFNGTTYDRARWFPQQTFATGTSDAFACYRNTPQTISVGGGVLSLSVVRVTKPVSCKFGKLSGATTIIAGSLMSYQRFTQQYGRFEARIKTEATTAPGLQETFWMWPDDRVPSAQTWPASGEIDVSETYSHRSSLSIPFLHYRADAFGQKAGLNTAYDCAAERGEWNTYTLIWTADRIEILVNGTSCLVNTSGDDAFMKPYLLAFTAALGAQDNAYDGRAPLPATMQVDYVHAWK